MFLAHNPRAGTNHPGVKPLERTGHHTTPVHHTTHHEAMPTPRMHQPTQHQRHTPTRPMPNTPQPIPQRNNRKTNRPQNKTKTNRRNSQTHRQLRREIPQRTTPQLQSIRQRTQRIKRHHSHDTKQKIQTHQASSVDSNRRSNRRKAIQHQPRITHYTTQQRRTTRVIEHGVGEASPPPRSLPPTGNGSRARAPRFGGVFTRPLFDYPALPAPIRPALVAAL